MMFVALALAAAAEDAQRIDPTIGVIVTSVIGAIATVAAAVFAGASARWSRSAHRELRPNGGSSTRDAIDAVRVELTLHRAESTAHRTEIDRRLTALEQTAAAPVHLVEPIAQVAPIPPVED